MKTRSKEITRHRFGEGQEKPWGCVLGATYLPDLASVPVGTEPSLVPILSVALEVLREHQDMATSGENVGRAGTVGALYWHEVLAFREQRCYLMILEVRWLDTALDSLDLFWT